MFQCATQYRITIYPMYISSSFRLFRTIQRTAIEGHTVASNTSWSLAEMRLSGSCMAIQSRFKPCSTSHGPHAGAQRSPDVTARHIRGTAVGLSVASQRSCCPLWWDCYRGKVWSYSFWIARSQRSWWITSHEEEYQFLQSMIPTSCRRSSSGTCGGKWASSGTGTVVLTTGVWP